ncbi:Solute carrier family 2, facilitated glucose transporter member 2 [Smittium mucronatum]|uniref:Solute carrier family 2, facilitated glucose transporter member 2 n=1 Tax=Smittium mucronatum TaxID=133383 RepID=A0A1R0H8V9_9FUNG|nr:Solute carrier family 2, facilitated glucose transporter member 2 [Smittium mucronatum]
MHIAVESDKEFSLSPLLSNAELTVEEIGPECQRFNPSGSYVSQKKSKLTRFCVLCGLIASLTSFMAGYKLAELNNPKDSIMNCNLERINGVIFGLPLCLPMSEVYFGFVTSVLAIGGLMGTMFSSKLADSYGRKNSLIINSIILIIGSIIEAFAYSPLMLVLGRFFSGIGAGIGFVIVPMYLTEIAPIESRGVLNTFNALGLTLGTFISQVMGHFLNIGHRWRIVLGAGICMSLLSAILLLYVVESPRYLYENNKERQSKISLRKLRGTCNIDEEIRSWKQECEKARIEKNESETNSYLSSDVEQNEYYQKVDEAEHKLNLISIFGVREYRQPVILAFFLRMCQQLSGINVVIFFSSTILNKTFTKSTSSMLTLLVGLIYFIFTILTAIIIDKIGRRKLLFSSMISMFISLGLLAMSLIYKFNYMSAISIFLAIMSFAPGLGTLPFLLTTEIFDTKAMAVGNSISIAVNWIFVFIVGSTFFPLQKLFGDYVFCLFMASLAFFGYFFYYYLPETKEKNFGQISEEFVL